MPPLTSSTNVLNAKNADTDTERKISYIHVSKKNFAHQYFKYTKILFLI